MISNYSILSCNAGIITSVIAFAIFCVATYWWIQHNNAIQDCKFLAEQICSTHHDGVVDAIPKYFKLEAMVGKHNIKIKLDNVPNIDLRMLAASAYEASSEYLIFWSKKHSMLQAEVLQARSGCDEVYLDSIIVLGPALASSAEKLKNLAKESEAFYVSHIMPLKTVPQVSLIQDDATPATT